MSSVTRIFLNTDTLSFQHIMLHPKQMHEDNKSAFMVTVLYENNDIRFMESRNWNSDIKKKNVLKLHELANQNTVASQTCSQDLNIQRT